MKGQHIEASLAILILYFLQIQCTETETVSFNQTSFFSYYVFKGILEYVSSIKNILTHTHSVKHIYY